MGRYCLNPNPPTPEEIAMIDDLWTRGTNKNEIGRQVGRSPAWVYKVIYQHILKITPVSK